MYQVVVKTSFVGFHYWKEAPDSVSFLRETHRHVFHVKLFKEVTDPNRGIEFITLKRGVDRHLRDFWEERTFRYACEQIAYRLAGVFDAYRVEVWEDDENGGIWERNRHSNN